MSAFLTSSLGNWPAHPQPLEGQGFQIPGPIRVQTLIPLACGQGKPVSLVFVPSYCWGSLFLVPGLVTIVVDKVERNRPSHRGGISCRGGWRGCPGMNRGFRAKNASSNLSSIISHPHNGIETWSLRQSTLALYTNCKD